MRSGRRRWRLGWVAGVGLVLAGTVAGVEPAKGVASELREPQRIVLGLDGDPARSQVVTWRTAGRVERAVAEVAVCTAGPELAAQARTVAATTTPLDVTPSGVAYHHEATFSGLEPDRLYCYRVGDGTTWSEWSMFRTASAAAAPFRFLYLGDAQDEVKAHWSRVVRAAYAKAPDARFIVHTGDLVREGFDDALWGEWSYALGFISAQIPFLAAPGNHDLHRQPGAGDPELVWSVQPAWRAHLALPSNGPQGLEDLDEAVWRLDYQGVRIIALDANVYSEEDFSPQKKLFGPAQVAWLERQLADNPNRFTIVVQHEPVYPVVKNRDYPELRGVLRPIFDKHHVDLVLSGHDHCYARSHKLAGDAVVKPAEPGTVYVISTGGPKMRQPTPAFRELMAVERGDAQMFQVISVGVDRLHYDAYTATGELVDAFELVKNAGGRSLYTDLAPQRARRSFKPDAR